MRKKKRVILIFLILLIIPISFAELSRQDLAKIENIVSQEVEEKNEKLRNDLNKDVLEVKKEVDIVLENIKGYQTKDKVILIAVLSSTIVVSLTIFSFFQFLIFRIKRKLKDKTPTLKDKIPTPLPAKPKGKKNRNTK